MKQYKSIREKKVKFYELDRTNRQLLGKSNRLTKMIEKRKEELKPLIYQLRLINSDIDKRRKEILKLETEHSSVKREIREIKDLNELDPRISISHSFVTINSKKYYYWYGKLRFEDKEKKIQISKRTERRTINKLNKYLTDKGIGFSDEEKKNWLKNQFKDEVLNWWRSEGVFSKKTIKKKKSF